MSDASTPAAQAKTEAVQVGTSAGTAADGAGKTDTAKGADGAAAKGTAQDAGNKSGATADAAVGSNATKTEGEKTKATEGDPAKANSGADADLVLKLPEGVTADEAVLGEFKELAKSEGLSGKQAQALVNFQLKLNERAQQHRAERDRGWVESVRKDKELGGDKFDATVTNARKAIDRFGRPALREFLDAEGLGSHPEMVRFCNEVAKALAEDSVAGTAGSGGAVTKDANAALAESLYTHPTSQKYKKE